MSEWVRLNHSWLNFAASYHHCLALWVHDLMVCQQVFLQMTTIFQLVILEILETFIPVPSQTGCQMDQDALGRQLVH